MGFFSKPRLPSMPESSEPSPEELDAEASAERRRRAAYGGGRASTIFTGPLGIDNENQPSGLRRFLGGGA